MSDPTHHDKTTTTHTPKFDFPWSRLDQELTSKVAYVIEPMTERDIDVVVAIDAPPRVGAAQMREELARPWSRQWVAREEGGEVVAFLLAWHVADELHVLNLGTRHDRRRRGIARALMNVALAYGREKHVARVLLEARRSNVAALSLYRSSGFVVTGVRARYYPDDEDALEMRLGLGSDSA